MLEAGVRASADEPVIFFCVEGAPREACHTRTGPDGSVTFETTFAARLVAAERDALRCDLAGLPIIVRHLLPSAIDLSALCDQPLEFHVAQRYAGSGRATIDAEIRDAGGRLLLWAHDGRMPIDRRAHGLALRVTVDADGRHRLAVGHGGGVASLGAPDLTWVQRGGDSLALMVVRVGADDVSFVLVRT